MLYKVMRPSVGDNPVFTGHGNLTQNRATARNRAVKCGGRLYAVDGGSTTLLADFYVEPAPVDKLQGRSYWQARNQAACFV